MIIFPIKVVPILSIFLWSAVLEANPAVKVIDFLSWEQVKLNTDAVLYKNVEIDGFIEFEGMTAFPVVRLWETSEAMKYKRPFKNITVDSESISHILLALGDSPAALWKKLNGRYVRLTGSFKDQTKGFDYINLGDFIEVGEFTVTNADGTQTSSKVRTPRTNQ